MKKLCMMLLILLGLSGCGKEKNENDTDLDNNKIEDNTLIFTELPVEFPMEEPHYTNEIEGLPEDLKLKETEGYVEDIMIKDDYAYYIVTYDHVLRLFCKEVAIFRQNLDSGNLEQLFKVDYDTGIAIIDLNFDDTSLYWSYYRDTQEPVSDDMSEIYYVDRWVDGEIEFDGSRKKTRIDESWKNFVPEEYVKEQAFYIGEKDGIVIWDQFEYANDSTRGRYIVFYNYETKEIVRISENEYGDVIRPILAGNYVFFLTYRDIKSFTSDNDLYDNIYAIDIYNYDVQRVTDNSNGSEDSLESTMFFNVEFENGYLFVISADTSVDENGNADMRFNRLHYMRQ
ncbi:MAG: hypothetical protein IJJ74_06140 [Eubacterium sp.]|nr:hypothetical protein [Eubacterium sp.]